MFFEGSGIFFISFFFKFIHINWIGAGIPFIGLWFVMSVRFIGFVASVDVCFIGLGVGVALLLSDFLYCFIELFS